MTTPDPVTPAGSPATAAARPDPERAVFRTALRDMLLLLAVLAVLGIGLGGLLAGTPGIWGALIGVGLALLFSGTTIVSMLLTSGKPATTMAAVVMGAWLAKVIVLVAVLAVLRGQDFYDRAVLAAVLVAGVVGSAFLDLRAVRGGRVPYVTPAPEGPGAG